MSTLCLLIVHWVHLVLPAEILTDLVDLILCGYQQLLWARECSIQAMPRRQHLPAPLPQLLHPFHPLFQDVLWALVENIDTTVSLRAKHSAVTYPQVHWPVILNLPIAVHSTKRPLWPSKQILHPRDMSVVSSDKHTSGQQTEVASFKVTSHFIAQLMFWIYQNTKSQFFTSKWFFFFCPGFHYTSKWHLLHPGAPANSLDVGRIQLFLNLSSFLGLSVLIPDWPRTHSNPPTSASKVLDNGSL